MSYSIVQGSEVIGITCDYETALEFAATTLPRFEFDGRTWRTLRAKVSQNPSREVSTAISELMTALDNRQGGDVRLERTLSHLQSLSTFAAVQ